MNFSKNRLQGFETGTPVYVMIHGLLRLMDGKNLASSFNEFGNPNIAFREAVATMVHTKAEPQLGEAWYYARMMPQELYNDLKDVDSFGLIHQLIHRDLEQRAYTGTHVNTCPNNKIGKLERVTRDNLYKILPTDSEDGLLLITARAPDGRMVLILA